MPTTTAGVRHDQFGSRGVGGAGGAGGWPAGSAGGLPPEGSGVVDEGGSAEASGVSAGVASGVGSGGLPVEPALAGGTGVNESGSSGVLLPLPGALVNLSPCCTAHARAVSQRLCRTGEGTCDTLASHQLCATAATCTMRPSPAGVATPAKRRGRLRHTRTVTHQVVTSSTALTRFVGRPQGQGRRQPPRRRESTRTARKHPLGPAITAIRHNEPLSTVRAGRRTRPQTGVGSMPAARCSNRSGRGR